VPLTFGSVLPRKAAFGRARNLRIGLSAWIMATSSARRDARIDTGRETAPFLTGPSSESDDD